MIKKIIYLILIFYCGSFFGCSDVNQELSGGYFFRDEGSDMKQILSHNSNKRNEIYSKVLKFNYDEDYIIAMQEPVYDDYVSMLAFKLRDDMQLYPENSKNDRISSEIIIDSILRNSDFYKKIFQNKLNYWIIDNKKDTLFGPMLLNEYLQKRDELKIPGNLQLE